MKKWYHWLWASPVIIICAVLFFLLWLTRIIKFDRISKPVLIFKPSKFLEYIWDWIPDHKIGGSKFVACSFSIFIIGDNTNTRLMKHELCHTKQVFEFGIFYPILYGVYWLIGFFTLLVEYSKVQKGEKNVDELLEEARGTCKLFKNIPTAAFNAYLNIPFEQEARRAELV